MSKSIIQTAKDYYYAGLKPLPTTSSKSPALRGHGAVKDYRNTPTSVDYTIQLFNNSPAISILTGQCSGNLEVIDIDLKNEIPDDTGRTLMDELWDAFAAHVGDLADTLPLVETKSGGFHLYYRCETIGGNQKLASRQPTPEEVAENPNLGPVVLVETRGEGGYVVAPPSAGYTLINGSLSDIPTITPEQRNGLLFACQSLDELATTQAKETTTKQAEKYTGELRPGDDFNARVDMERILALMQKHGWSESYRSRDGNKIFVLRPGTTESKTSGHIDVSGRVLFVFSTSSIFQFTGNCGGFGPFQIYTILEHGGDYKAAARELAANGYGQPSPSRGKSKPSTESDTIQQNDLLTFWSVIYVKKTDSLKPVFSRIKFISWLNENGFGRYHYTPDSWALIRHQSNIVEKISKSQLKKFVLDYIQTLPESFDGITRIELAELVARGVSSFFSDELLELLPAIEIDSYRDTKDSAYLYFKNCVVKVDPEKVTMMDYEKLDGFVWYEQIRGREFTPHSDFENNYQDFIEIICGREDKAISADVFNQRLDAVMRVIGFGLHSYKDPVNCPAVILYDESQDQDNPEGGTGKGIFLNGLSYLKNMYKIDGKIHSLDSSFPFQGVDIDTQLLIFEDVKKGWKFERIFSITTEGITIEKKGKDSFYIPFDRSAKIFITSNYPIEGQGSSHERRRLEIEFNGFFRNKLPYDYFKQRLFDDWSEQHWQKFDNYMVYCLGLFLKNGLVRPPVINLNERKLKSRTHPQFISFIRNFLKVGRYSYREVHSALTTFNRDFDRYKQTTITRWTNIYMKADGVDFDKIKINDGISHVNGFEVNSMPKSKQNSVTTLGKTKVVNSTLKVEESGKNAKPEQDDDDTLPF